MKISYYLPKGKKNYGKFIESEIEAARNIKSKQTRDSMIKGLTKIKNNMQDGRCCFWDGKELSLMDYGGKDFLYKCSKEFDYSPIKTKQQNRYLLITLDANECTIGEMRGKNIVTLWNKQSNVPRKHDAGGQSQRRFERDRQEKLKQWLKICADKIRELTMSLG